MMVEEPVELQCANEVLFTLSTVRSTNDWPSMLPACFAEEETALLLSEILFYAVLMQCCTV